MTPIPNPHALDTVPGDPRVLVLGSEKHGRKVRAHSWRALPKSLNVADYEVVILNFQEFLDETVRTNVALDRLPSTEDFARLIFSEGSIVIAIGGPRFEFGWNVDDGFGRARWSYMSTNWWLPVELPFKMASGEAIKVLDPAWGFWFTSLKRFEWHFWNVPKLTTDVSKVGAGRAAVPWAQWFLGEWKALAETRYGDPLGVRLEIAAGRESDPGTRFRSAEYRTEVAPAAIYWLHESTELSQHEAVAELLRTVVGVGVETPPPEWVERFRLPRELAAAERVEERRHDLDTASEALTAAEAEAAMEGRFAGLLFEQGKENLEPLVRDALELLGASVAEPELEGIEDGRLTDPQGRTAMLEIKGRRGQLKLEDVRQLDGWMRTAMAEEGWSGKGIVVANLKLEEAPDERRDLVAPNALAFAERIGVAVLTTIQLHEALRQLQESRLDRGVFWDAVFEATGLVRGLS